MNLLAIDTASGQCSAALQVGDQVTSQAVPTARDHAQLLLPMIDTLLQAAGLGLADLAAIAFGRGPGSFTGLRIAASCAQGLALGSGRGVLPVSDLRALAEQALRRAGRDPAITRVIACMDARMSEVYWACFDVREGEIEFQQAIEHVGSADSVRCAAAPGALAAAGRGLAAWPAIALALQVPPTRCFDDAEPHAVDILRMAALDLSRGARPLPPEAAQPIYLRDQVAQPAPTRVSGAL